MQKTVAVIGLCVVAAVALANAQGAKKSPHVMFTPARN